MTFKFGYSTYALKMIDPFQALGRIKDHGYEAIEICAREGWPTSPNIFGVDQQRKLAETSRRLGFPSPIIFGAIDVCAAESDREAMMKDAITKFRFARELHYDDTPTLLTTTSGGSAPAWELGKVKIRDAFLRLADVAAEHDVIVAIEAHAGTDFETPEKAAWIMDQTKHSNLKLDLDISHFYVEGAEVEHSVDLCAADSVMVHIKDGEKIDGKIQFCLTGDGNIDIECFLGSLKKNNIDDLPVYVEVSVMQSGHIDYDPWAAAKLSYDALLKASEAIA